MFRGTESAAEEKAEARAVRSGKISPKQYVAGEKSEGEKEPGMMARAKALKSGKMSPAAYAKHEGMEKMKRGGCATKKMAAGGGVEAKGKTKGTQVKMSVGKTGTVKKMAKGGGVEVKGKTKGRMV